MHHVRDLADAIRADLHFNTIVGISRGGLIPATLVAEALKVRHVISINANSYEGFEQSRLGVQVNEFDAALLRYLDLKSKVLLIDDIADTGLTMKAVLARFPTQVFVLPVAIVAKPKGKDTIRLWATEVPQDCWVHFPWEV